MATSETTLLQFVALALPAVAILMQAILSFQDNYGLERTSSNTVRTEFRFIELSFIGLVVAGGLFGVSLFGTIETIWAKIGLISMLLGLGFLAPATWLALRRPKYPSKSYDSPEDAAISGLKYTLTALFSLAIVGAIGYYLLNLFPDLGQGISPEEFANSLKNFMILAIFLTLTSSIIQAFTFYQQSAEEKRERKEWRSNTRELLSDLAEFLPDQPPSPGYSDSMNVLVRFEEYEQRIDDLISDAPEDIETSELESIRTNIEVYKELAERRQEILDELGMINHELGEMESELEAINNALGDLPEDSDEWSDLRSRKEMIQERIVEAESKISEAENREARIMEDMENNLDDLQQLIYQAQGQFEEQ